MIKNIQKTFIFLTFFSIANTVFCAENQMTLQDVIPFIEKTRKLYEEIQISVGRQGESLYNNAESINQLQQNIESEGIKYTDLVTSLRKKVDSQELIINDLGQQNVALLKMFHEQKERLDKLQQDLSQMTSSQNNIAGELRKATTIINSPTGNNNNHNVVIQNTSAMGSVIVGGSSITSGPNGKTLFFNSILFVGLLIAYIKWYS